MVVLISIERAYDKKLESVHSFFFFLNIYSWVFPGGPVVKNPPCSAEDTGSTSGPGRSYMPQGY